jgi:hypothetical protein
MPPNKTPKKNKEQNIQKSVFVGYCSLPKSMPKVGSDEEAMTARAHAHKLAGPPD